MALKIMTFLVGIGIMLAIDYYVYQWVMGLSQKLSSPWRMLWRTAYWVPTVIILGLLIWWSLSGPYRMDAQVRNWAATFWFAVYLSKIFSVLFLFVDDIQRGIRKAIPFFRREQKESLPGEPITRSSFLSTAALVAAAVPFTTVAFGILSGAHDYRVRRRKVYLPNLPKAFDGIRIGQVSDIHSGSFYHQKAVQGGVDLFLSEKPDVIFFTGDLVNNETSEVKEYIDVFAKLKAPLGVYSVTGNHDYGNYRAWPTEKEKQKNFQDLIHAHREMGYDLLMNEHRYLELGGERIGIIGIENWGTGRFPKYGDLKKAHGGVEAPVKLLLSHDPSHWDAEVRPQYPDIDVMFSGHTHGFQFGVELGNIRWSPSQYLYKQWADLYQQGQQYLYVNRGFGFIGYPGRIGIAPELTILELKRGPVS